MLAQYLGQIFQFLAEKTTDKLSDKAISGLIDALNEQKREVQNISSDVQLLVARPFEAGLLLFQAALRCADPEFRLGLFRDAIRELMHAAALPRNNRNIDQLAFATKAHIILGVCFEILGDDANALHWCGQSFDVGEKLASALGTYHDQNSGLFGIMKYELGGARSRAEMDRVIEVASEVVDSLEVFLPYMILRYNMWYHCGEGKKWREQGMLLRQARGYLSVIFQKER